MKKLLKIFAVVLTAAVLAVSLASCDFIDTLLTRGKESDPATEVAKLTFSDAEYVYDGGAHSIEVVGSLPKGVTVSYEGNGKVEVGEYTVVAKFYYNGEYLSGSDKTANMNIVASSLSDATNEQIAALLADISMAGGVFVYDGEVKSLEISGELPEGVSVKYKNNGKTKAGSYNVVAEFYYGEKYISGCDRIATLTIKKASYDMSGVTFESKTVTYNGENHKLEISGELPEGVSVIYNKSSCKNAGVYNIVASFTSSDIYNYEPIEAMNATLTIEKASYDMSGVSFNDGTVEYDNKEHVLEITGELPEGVSVSYGDGFVYPGSYDIVATFTVSDPDNYNVPADMTAVLTIYFGANSIIDFSGLTFPDAEGAYNGTVHKHEVTGYVPYGVTVEYTADGNMTDVGVYKVTAKFFYDGEEIDDAEMVSTYTVKKADIDMSKISFAGKMVEYDGKAHSLEITGTLPAGVTVSYSKTDITEAGIYEITASFTVSDSKNYNTPDSITEILAIASDGVSTDGLIVENGEVVGYNGASQYVVIPAKYNGSTVTSVKSGAFSGKNIKAVYVPSTVTNIGNNAFRDCSSLDTVYIGKNVKIIGQKAFAGTAIKSIVLPDALEYIGIGALADTTIETLTVPFIGDARISSTRYLATLFGAPDYAREGVVPETLKEVILSSACTEIPAYAFYGLDSIEKITIGAGVTEIGSNAFRGCTSLKSIYIPATVAKIPANAYYYNSPFFECSNELVIYLEAADATAYGRFWNAVSDGKTATVVYNADYEEYAENN